MYSGFNKLQDKQADPLKMSVRHHRTDPEDLMTMPLQITAVLAAQVQAAQY